MKIGITSRFDVDPKVVTTYRLGRGNSKIAQLGLNVFVSDTRQERVVSSLAKRFGCGLVHKRSSIGPETNVEFVEALAEFLAQHLLYQQTYARTYSQSLRSIYRQLFTSHTSLFCINSTNNNFE